jgi:hypothetical protein
MPITTETTKFLELIWGYKDKSILSMDKDSEIVSQLMNQPNEAIFHIEFREGLAVVWRAGDWESDIRKHQLEKENAEIRLREHDNRKETFVYLRSLVLEKLGEMAGEMLADSIVTKIMEKKNVTMAKGFGAEEEKLRW